MPRQLDWSLSFPIQDGVLSDDALVVRSRSTSGAGQFEITGSAEAPDGTTISPRDVAGRKITFVLPAPKGGGAIRLGESYPVQEVGGKIRVSVQGEDAKRPNIGNLFAAAFMLPNVSSRLQSLPFDDVDLGEKTYWIDDVSCHIVAVDDDSIVLQPDQFIFASSNKKGESRPSMMARFDYNARLDALYSACKRGASVSCGSAKAAFAYYRDYLTGNIPFEFEMAFFMKGYVMSWLEKNASGYTHTQDPLPVLSEEIPEDKIDPILGKEIAEPRNLIYCGAPGTGKSYQLDEDAKPLFHENITRVTFYPDYTYSQFVGCYRPRTDEKDDITYGYVAGPFLDTYLKACTHPDNDYVLVVEEINRANSAGVFGDLLQLLDRYADGGSKYPVVVPDDMGKCIKDRLKELTDEEKKNIESHYEQDMDFSEFCAFMTSALSLPPNMYIWATMNSADQGVFPMDTAFKRRWDFRYIGINENETAKVIIDNKDMLLNEVGVSWGKGKTNWNNLRKAINGFLSKEVKVNEDKLLGPFFLDPSGLYGDRFADVFKDKVLLYLYEDACKMNPSKVFADNLSTYSEVCEAFDERGPFGVFKEGVKKRYEELEKAHAADEDIDSAEG